MKRIFVLFLTAVILVSSFSAFAYTVEEAYEEVLAEHPDFFETLSSENITKDELISFFSDVQSYLNEADKKTKITEENFESNAMLAVMVVSSRDEHLKLQDALIVLFPKAIKEVITSEKIPAEFQPLTDTVKRIVFRNGMIGNGFAEENPEEEVFSPEISFTDIDSSFWCYDAIYTLANKFILNGYLDKTFKPNENITRAEFAKIIVSATETLDIDAEAQFSDVTKDDWYYNYVASAVKNGYIKGYPDNSFRANEAITRADLCTVVYRCVKENLKSAEVTPFSDDNLIAPYAREGIYALKVNGIIDGVGDGSFAPLEPATRAQTAKIIYSVFFEKS